MSYPFCLVAIVCWFTQLLAATHSLAAAVPGPTVIKNIPYAGASFDARRSFDLYLPGKSNAKPPLLIFVHGGFWLLPDDEYRIGPALAESLVKDGVAVALVRYRLAPSHRHPVQAQDVASAVARLAKDADKYGFDAKRIFLSGHSAGGYLASLIALDNLSGQAKNSRRHRRRRDFVQRALRSRADMDRVEQPETRHRNDIRQRPGGSETRFAGALCAA
jgi:acetyl esterase/lipase